MQRFSHLRSVSVKGIVWKKYVIIEEDRDDEDRLVATRETHINKKSDFPDRIIVTYNFRIYN